MSRYSRTLKIRDGGLALQGGRRVADETRALTIVRFMHSSRLEPQGEADE